MGVEPGLSDVFARYAADHLFDVVDEVGVRDGADLVVDGYGFAPTFSIWTTIEECLNPPVVYEKERGWYTTAPFSEPEVFDFPTGSARWSASTSSTRRCSSCPDTSTCGG
jgi:saccharopine dehydrogenase-like NADP-dependent oxidoreductase